MRDTVTLTLDCEPQEVKHLVALHQLLCHTHGDYAIDFEDEVWEAVRYTLETLEDNYQPPDDRDGPYNATENFIQYVLGSMKAWRDGKWREVHEPQGG